MGFPRQGLPFPPPGDLPNAGIEPTFPKSPALQADSLPLGHLGLKIILLLNLGFSCHSAGKGSACNLEDLGSIPGLGRSPREVKVFPLLYSGLENSMDCTWGHKESDMTE